MQYQSDYVLRLIEQMGSLIRRAMEKVGVGEAEEPYELCQEALGLALDIDPATTIRLAPTTLVSLIEMSNADDRVIALIADALEVEAEALEHAGEMLDAQTRHQQAQAVRAMLGPSHAN